MMKLIEFAMKNNQTYLVGLFDCNEITTIEQLDKKSCRLIMKDGRAHTVPGLYRNLTNRFIYCLEKKIDPYQDSIIRPTILFFHNTESIEEDSVFFDKEQINAFSKALGIVIKKNKLGIHLNPT